MNESKQFYVQTTWADESGAGGVGGRADKAILSVDGQSVMVTVQKTSTGPRLLIDPMPGTTMEGDEPGAYYLATDPDPPVRFWRLHLSGDRGIVIAEGRTENEAAAGEAVQQVELVTEVTDDVIRGRLKTLPFAIRYEDEEVAELVTTFDLGKFTMLREMLSDEARAHIRAGNAIKAECFARIIVALDAKVGE